MHRLILGLLVVCLANCMIYEHDIPKFLRLVSKTIKVQGNDVPIPNKNFKRHMVDISCINLDQRHVQVDRMCPKNSKRCYNTFVGKWRAQNQEEIFYYGMSYDDRAAGLETIVRLLPPKNSERTPGESQCIDFRTWSIDHSYFAVRYIAGMLAASFMMSSLPLNTAAYGKQFLEIGLGGGTLDMGLHTLKPEVNITAVEIEPVVMKQAFKWFDVVDSETHHTVLEDGVKFLANAEAEEFKMKQLTDALRNYKIYKSSGRKFDVVALDACGPASLIVACPAVPFHNLRNLRKIRNILTRTGSLIVNLASLDTTEYGRRKRNKVLNKFKAVFPLCVQMKFPKQPNVVLACSPFSKPHISDPERYFNDRLATVISRLRLGYILDGAYIKVLNNE